MVNVTRRLASMPDLLEEDISIANRSSETLRKSLGQHGYQLVDTPMLELTELFLRKSGGGLASQMYTFIEPGGERVSLRPEFTAAIIRMFLERSEKEVVPVRWQYVGPVFRYLREQSTGLRQFTQIGAELIGADGPYPDAEILALSCESLQALPLGELGLSIGNVGIVQALLNQFNVSERVSNFLLNSLSELRKGNSGVKNVMEQARRLGILVDKDSLTAVNTVSLNTELENLTRHLLAEPTTQSVGVRSVEEIRTRMLWKMRLSDSPDNVESCFAFARSLSMLHGQPESVLQNLRQLITTHGLEPVGLDDLNTTINVFRSHNLENVRLQLDFALVGKLSYYSGLVFEIRTLAEDTQSVLGGGGRYNDLIRALGGSKDIPALGFAYNLEQIVDSLRQDLIKETHRKPTLILVIPGTTQSYNHALRVARGLRQSGNSVEVSSVNPKWSAQKVYAKRRNIDTIVTVGSNGETQQYSISN